MAKDSFPYYALWLGLIIGCTALITNNDEGLALAGTAIGVAGGSYQALLNDKPD